MPLSYHTAGESHGPALIALVNGLPAGVEVDAEFINSELSRRQGGYGRGARQKIEDDRVTFLSGVRRIDGVVRTIGSPIAMQILNIDSRLDDPARTPPVYRPRPGHADLAGALKHLTTDCRETLERASARETAARTAAGALARCLLREFEIEAFGFVRGMMDAVMDDFVVRGPWSVELNTTNNRSRATDFTLDDLFARRQASEVYCPDPRISERIIAHIHQAKVEKDTVGGLCEVQIVGCPPGLGSCANWHERLDARLAAAVMGIQAFKAVEIGLGKDCAFQPGSQVHDPIMFDEAQRETATAGFVRPSNNAGGLEGGMTNGMPVVIRGTMKPISTLLRGMPSVDLNSKTAEHSDYERSDVCALPAASVVMENVVAFEIARAFLEKFAGDSMHETQANYENYVDLLRRLPLGNVDNDNGEIDQSER